MSKYIRVPVHEQDMITFNYALGSNKKKSMNMGEQVLPSAPVKTMISYPIIPNIDPPSLAWFESKFKYDTNILCANTDCHQPASQCEYRMVSYTNESLFNHIYVLPTCQNCNYPFELAQVFSNFIDNYVAGTIKIHLSTNEE